MKQPTLTEFKDNLLALIDIINQKQKRGNFYEEIKINIYMYQKQKF